MADAEHTMASEPKTEEASVEEGASPEGAVAEELKQVRAEGAAESAECVCNGLYSSLPPHTLQPG